MRAIDLEAVLTGVTRPADDNGLAINVYRLGCVEHQFLTRKSEYLFHHSLRFRSLNSKLSVVVGAVLQIDVEPLGLLLHPCPVLVDVCRIDYQEVVLFAHLIYQEVVNGTTILITHHSIINLSVGRTRDIIGEDMVHIAFRLSTLDGYFTHVTHIEHPAMLSYGIVLINDVRILYRHVKAAKG